MSSKLKSCPHCHEVPEIYALGRDWYRLATKCQQGCINFERETDYPYSKSGYNFLVADWNYRPMESELLQALKELLETCHATKEGELQRRKAIAVIEKFKQ